MQNRVLLQLKSISLTHEFEPLPDVKETVINTLLGNPNGIRYRLLDTEKKLNETEHLNFFTLRKDGELIYVMALIERITYFQNQACNTYYVRYVTFVESFASHPEANEEHNHKNSTQSKKNSKLEERNTAIQQRIGNSFLKEGMRKYAEDYPFTIQNEDADPQKRLYYAYVEETNTRSLNFTEFFFERIGTFGVIPFSRLKPAKDVRFSSLNENQADQMMDLLKKTYANHSLFFVDREDIKQNYFVLTENGRIVAGTRARTSNWKIEQIPGLVGKVFLRIIPAIPYFSRIIFKKRFRFLTLDTLYCEEGREKEFIPLFESLCAERRVYAGLIYLDKSDKFFNKLSGLENMGFLNRMFKNAGGGIMARFVNYNEEEKMYFRENPAYLDGYDLT